MSLQENSRGIPFHSELPVKENAGLFFKEGDSPLKGGCHAFNSNPSPLKGGCHIFKGKLSSLKSGHHILKGGHYVLKKEDSPFKVETSFFKTGS
jgi:hypothetical protein